MTTKRLIGMLAILTIIVNLFIVGCDRFHVAQVTIDQASEEEIISAVKEFATKLNFACKPTQRSLYIIECGPEPQFSLYKKDRAFILTLFQLWGSSAYFCNVQGQMFEYFSQKFGVANVRLETNDSCGRKNYP